VTSREPQPDEVSVTAQNLKGSAVDDETALDAEDQDERAGIIIKNHHGRVVIEGNYFGDGSLIVENTRNAIVRGNYTEDTSLPSYSISDSEGTQISDNWSVRTYDTPIDSLGYELINLRSANVDSNSSIGNYRGFKVDGFYKSNFRNNKAILEKSEYYKRIRFDRKDMSRLVHVILRIGRLIGFPLDSGTEISALKFFLTGFMSILAARGLDANTPYIWKRVFENILRTKANRDLGVYYGDLEDLLWSLDSIIVYMHRDL
jgi:hypothetical protein